MLFRDGMLYQYEFIVVNGQTTTSAFHKGVQQQWGGPNYGHLPQVSLCQKLLQLANVSRSYSKNNTGTVFLRHVVYIVCVVWQAVGSLTSSHLLNSWSCLISSQSLNSKQRLVFVDCIDVHVDDCYEITPECCNRKNTHNLQHLNC